MGIKFEKQDIKDRVSTTDDLFTITDEGDKKRLTPDTSGVQVVGTKVNKALLQRYEDYLGQISTKATLWTNPDTSVSYTEITLDSGYANDYDFLIIVNTSGISTMCSVDGTKISYNNKTLTLDGNKITLSAGDNTIATIKGINNGYRNIFKCYLRLTNITATPSEITYQAGDIVEFVLSGVGGLPLPETIEFSSEITDAFYDSETGQVRFTAPNSSTYIVAESEVPTLENASWELIRQFSEQGIASQVWAVGDTKSVSINGQTHYVRIIAFNHDKDANDNTLGITFEFANIISDTNGNSLGIVWNDTNDTSSSGTCNKDYINSSIRKALCGNGNFSGDILYAQKGATSFSATYKNRTILSMLPSDLVAVLKTTKKSVGIGESYTETSYTDKLFMLSTIEMGYTSQYDKGFGTTYSYYSGHTEQTDAIRIKKQVNNSEVYTSSSNIPSGSGQAYQGTVYNYAGYNYKTDNTGGGYYWYRSPYSYYADGAWRCDRGGRCDGYGYAYYNARGVAPAFCI